MELEIHTWDKTLLFDILDKSSASIGDAITIPGDAKLTYKGTLICKALGIPRIINFVLTFGSGVAAGVVANWIYDKLKHRVEKIVINKKEIQLDKREIKRIIEERL